jgi:hypothetical protein
MAYTGNRIIYVGEDEGHTGDHEMRLMLDRDWTEVDSRRPVQWWELGSRVGRCCSGATLNPLRPPEPRTEQPGERHHQE